MKSTNLKNCVLFAVIFACIHQISIAQTEEHKWVFGIGMNAVDFFPFETEGMTDAEIDGRVELIPRAKLGLHQAHTLCALRALGGSFFPWLSDAI